MSNKWHVMSIFVVFEEFKTVQKSLPRAVTYKIILHSSRQCEIFTHSIWLIYHRTLTIHKLTKTKNRPVEIYFSIGPPLHLIQRPPNPLILLLNIIHACEATKRQVTLKIQCKLPRRCFKWEGGWQNVGFILYYVSKHCTLWRILSDNRLLWIVYCRL